MSEKNNGDFKKKVSDTVSDIKGKAGAFFSKYFQKTEAAEAEEQLKKKTKAPAPATLDDQPPTGGTALARTDRSKTRVPGAPSRSTLDASEPASGAGGLPPFFKKRNKRPNFIVSIIMTTLTMYLVVAIVFCFAAAGAVMGIAKAYTETVQDLDVNVIMDQDQTSFIYDKDGNLITTFASIENRVVATYDEIPKNLLNAFVAIEDSRFWTHNGVDLKRLIGVFFANFASDSVQGGSTITQQLIKQRILSSERSYKRKIQEAYLALQLEKVYSKEQIITAYLNTINLGASNYGVKAAAFDYFGKEDLNDLTLRECAVIAGITQNPYKLNPRYNYYDRNTPDVTDDRTDTVLYRMYACDFITKEEYEAARDDQVTVIEESQSSNLYEMMYFVEYAVYDVVSYMLQLNNLEDTSANRSLCENDLRTGGYSIYLTVDPKAQTETEQLIYNYTSWPKLSSSADNVISSQNADGTVVEIPQPQVSIAVLDQNTGEMKVIIGGRQAPTAQKQLNRAYQSSMPIGSSIKPIAVYGPAFDNGASPGTVVADLPVAIEGWGGKGYPNNYSYSFSGMTNIYAGLRNSLNVIAARVLATYVGVETSTQYLLNMGVSESHINQDLAGLALGTSGITMVELVACYGTIANDGVYVQPTSFSGVYGPDGSVVIDPYESRITRRIYKQTSVYMLKSIMLNYTSGAVLSGMPMGGKTGTNSDWRGCTFCGFTAYYTCVLWIGHDNYKPLAKGTTGSAATAPLWKKIMAPMHAGLPYRDIQQHSAGELGLISVTVCGVSGALCNDACRADAEHPVSTGYYVPGTQPTAVCTMHVSTTVCSATGLAASPYCPSTKPGAALNLTGTPYAGVAAKYFSNAVTNVAPEYAEGAEGYCTLHTSQWRDYYDAVSSAITTAQNAIAAANVLLSSSYLSSNVRATLNSYVSAASSKLGSDYSASSIADLYAADAAIRAAASDLSNYTTGTAQSDYNTNYNNAHIPTPPPVDPPDEGGGEEPTP